MGGGGGAVAVAAAAAEREELQAALADLARVVPWACQVRGCSDKSKNGATHKYIASHRKTHTEEANKQRKLEAKRAADIAQQERAAGPSGKRKQNRLKDMRDKQRAAAKAATKGSGNGNGNSSAGGRKGRSKRA